MFQDIGTDGTGCRRANGTEESATSLVRSPCGTAASDESCSYATFAVWANCAGRTAGTARTSGVRLRSARWSAAVLRLAVAAWRGTTALSVRVRGLRGVSSVVGAAGVAALLMLLSVRRLLRCAAVAVLLLRCAVTLLAAAILLLLLVVFGLAV